MSDVPRYHLVQHVDGNAGFCAILTYTLNGIRMAVRDRAIPVALRLSRRTQAPGAQLRHE